MVPSPRPSTPMPSVARDSASTEELLDKTLQFHARMARSRRLLDSVSHNGPRSVVGYDRTRCVSVTVGTRDEFLRAHVDDHWERRLDPGHLGQAVIDAAQDAQRVRSAGTAIAPAVLQRLRARSDNDLAPSPLGAPPNVGDPSIRSARQLAGEMLDLASNASGHSDTENAGHGAGAEGWVRAAVNSTGVLVGCDVAAYWAAGRDGSEIAAAIDQAVADALRDLATKPAAPDPLTQANRLITDGLAYLVNHDR
ncbi:hypothetical protein NFA_26500 [Nocardia farcinica IFM 10152]|uniref:YbaB/EbfC DNA-binding family protein n=1 Tax=Nocardia farcinica (strain IFM 10152) TaxID=247156 RepID=Q5YWE4_NOCFA|nr:hypothetical protein NFA_26500 [Nocardia farcinica IFM 10152]